MCVIYQNLREWTLGWLQWREIVKKVDCYTLRKVTMAKFNQGETAERRQGSDEASIFCYFKILLLTWLWPLQDVWVWLCVSWIVLWGQGYGGWGGWGMGGLKVARLCPFCCPLPKNSNFSCIYFTFRFVSNLVQAKDTEANNECENQCSIEKL